MGFEHLKLGQLAEGYWGSHTASIDWCEDNYAASRYIAEFFNTVTNLPFIALGIYGWYRIRQAGLPKRYGFALLGLSIIGCGSLGFHLTLKWEWQLMDELPMIYLAMLCFLLMWDTLPGFNMRWGMHGIAAMLAFDVWLTASYIAMPNPIYHQLAFALIQFAGGGRCIYLYRTRLPPSDKHPARRDIYRLTTVGAAIFATGFAIRNVDNILCNTLRQWREAISPFGFLLECHGWWHLLTGLGAYYFMQGAIYLCLCVKSDPDAYKVKWDLLPYIVPNPSARTNETLANGEDEKL
ncbi:alkaline ceramidase ydc1 [Naganishia albida]|nr:alkaline ceramidase ydc1 [Naganishia albida]